MNFKKGTIFKVCVSGVIAVLLMVLLFGVTSTEGAKVETGWKEWGKKYWPTKPVRGGYFRRAAVKYVGLMNPNHWPINDFRALRDFYESIIYRDGSYKASVPWLAKSWKNLNSTTVVMKLRNGVKFHDGSDFDANSVKYQLEWILDKKNGCWSRTYLRTLKSVKVIDKYSLKFRFKEPWGAFLGSLPAGIPGWSISSEALKKDVELRELKKFKKKLKSVKKKLAKYERKGKAEKAAKYRKEAEKLEKKVSSLTGSTRGAKKTDINPVGTGPFILEEARPGNYLKSKRNPNWWFGKSVGKPGMPYFDGVKIIVIPDPAVQLANLRSGKIDTMNVDKYMYNMIKNDPALNVHIYPMNSLSGLRFNHAKGPCKNILVRKAVSHAIDRKALIRGTQFGLGRIASCMYPEDHWCHNPKLKPVRYDPELSKRLLARAGYRNGLTLRGYMGNTTAAVNMGEAVKEMLAKVGINWKFDSLESAASTDRMKNLDYELAGSGYPHINDPDLIAINLYHPDGGFNHGRSHNKKAIALIKAGKREVNSARRQRIYYKLEKVLYDNYEDVWFWWGITVTAYRKSVQGWNNKMYKKYREGHDYSHPLWFKNGKPE